MVLNKSEILELLNTNKFNLSQFGLKKIGLFGSFARNEQTENSDIDLLIEFNEGNKNYKNFMRVSNFLEQIFNRKIEIVTEASLPNFVKEKIKQDIQYTAL